MRDVIKRGEDFQPDTEGLLRRFTARVFSVSADKWSQIWFQLARPVYSSHAHFITLKLQTDKQRLKSSLHKDTFSITSRLIDCELIIIIHVCLNNLTWPHGEASTWTKLGELIESTVTHRGEKHNATIPQHKGLTTLPRNYIDANDPP